MKLAYYFLAAMLLMASPQQAAAQDFTDCPANEDECVVEWDSGTGEPIINALTNTIANDDDRTAGRVYVLKRGGYYYNDTHITNSGFDLRIVGQTADQGAASGENVCGDGDDDCGPAIIQRFQNTETGATDPLMIESSGDSNGGLTLKNVWLMGLDNTGAGAYEPITVNSSNSTFVFDNVVFDRNTWHHLGFKSGGGNEIYITNSFFRNASIQDQIWGGRALRLEGGAAVVMFENNSFFNLTSFPFQSESQPVGYFAFNHNTLVNFGRNFATGNIWQQAYLANNLFINPFWQGESQEQYDDRLATWLAQGNTEASFDPFVGVFNISALPPRFGLEDSRRILLANNNWWRDPALEAFYGDLSIHTQPLVSDSTQSFFDLYDGMVIQDNLNQQPGIGVAPTTAEVYAQMETFVSQWVNAEATPWELVYWDPGRDANPLANVWPLPEDFTYTNTALLDHGTDGLPLGDLNWFPDAKADYLANRDAYLAQLEELAGGTPEETIALPSSEAEAGILDGSAEVQSVEGFTYYEFGSGTIEWTFELAEATTVDLNVWTNLKGNDTRGQKIIINGVNQEGGGIKDCFGYGEYIWDIAYDPDSEPCENPHVGIPADEWVWTKIIQSEVSQFPEALDLPAGMNTIRIEPSWGDQQFAGIDVLEAGTENVLVELRAPDANAVGPGAFCETEPGGDPLDYCPNGFQWVALGAGGSVSWSVELVSNAGSVLPQFFYTSASGGTAELSLDGVKVADIMFPASSGATYVLGDRFNVGGGAHTMTLNTVGGDINLDYAIFNTYEGTTTGIEDNELPDGYALRQNYPNPFNPVTTIQYELGAVDHISITVYDVLGRKVTTLVDGTQVAGPHQIAFDGSSLASGVYFYRLQTSVGQQVRRMVLLK